MSYKKILSLFDGMSCGQIALNRSKSDPMKDYVYYASEIDKHAIKITKKNFPNTKHIGSVTDIITDDYKDIYLLIGGSPCQGFSKAGKQLNFDDPRSKLFFEYVRILKETRPKYFLLENVFMKKEYQNIITEYLGVEPILINSNLKSAQNRPRLYWTNIPNITLPEDKNVFLSDILLDSVDIDEKYYIDPIKLDQDLYNKYINSGIIANFTERRTEEAKRLRTEYRKLYGKDFSPRRMKEMVARSDNKSNCITSTYSIKEHLVLDKSGRFRKFHPIEWERLQTIDDNYTYDPDISDSQRYKMLGNGWTIDIITHLLKSIF